MSLVGSLEDLGLGDILQIVHLAAKSGVLRLRNEFGEGQLVFQRGMIHEAYVKGGPTDLRELLASRRAVPEKVLERIWLEAHHGGRSLAELLVERMTDIRSPHANCARTHHDLAVDDPARANRIAEESLVYLASLD